MEPAGKISRGTNGGTEVLAWPRDDPLKRRQQHMGTGQRGAEKGGRLKSQLLLSHFCSEARDLAKTKQEPRKR